MKRNIHKGGTFTMTNNIDKNNTAAYTPDTPVPAAQHTETIRRKPLNKNGTLLNPRPIRFPQRKI
jgi:hypothetical protein